MKDLLEKFKDLDPVGFANFENMISAECSVTLAPDSDHALALLQHTVQKRINARADPEAEKRSDTWGFEIKLQRGTELDVTVYSGNSIRHVYSDSDSPEVYSIAKALLECYINVLGDES